MNIVMRPTYSIVEMKELLRSLEENEINILAGLVEEEREAFTATEMKAANRMISIRRKQLIPNEINCDFLLSFN
jgi:hypothetical protein